MLMLIEQPAWRFTVILLPSGWCPAELTPLNRVLIPNPNNKCYKPQELWNVSLNWSKMASIQVIKYIFVVFKKYRHLTLSMLCLCSLSQMCKGNLFNVRDFNNTISSLNQSVPTWQSILKANTTRKIPSHSWHNIFTMKYYSVTPNSYF